MNRRNFLQLLGAVALCSMVGITPDTRLAREDEDRATRLARLAQDHTDQLEGLARLHAMRLAQIEEYEREAVKVFRLAPGAISVYAAPGATPQEIAQAVNIEIRRMYGNA